MLVGMNNDQHSKAVTQTQKNEPVFARGVLIIEELNCVLIQEDRTCFAERNSVFA